MSFPLKANDDVRAATRSDSIPASALMISSVMPSLKYSASGPALMFRNGSTAIEVSALSPSRAEPVAGERGPEGSRSAACSANAKSRADWKRSSGLFSRLCVRISASSTGTPRPVLCEGSSWRMLIIVSTGFSRWKARFPVSIS